MTANAAITAAPAIVGRVASLPGTTWEVAAGGAGGATTVELEPGPTGTTWPLAAGGTMAVPEGLEPDSEPGPTGTIVEVAAALEPVSLTRIPQIY